LISQHFTVIVQRLHGDKKSVGERLRSGFKTIQSDCAATSIRFEAIAQAIVQRLRNACAAFSQHLQSDFGMFCAMFEQ
jgi:hypothetical protein